MQTISPSPGGGMPSSSAPPKKEGMSKLVIIVVIMFVLGILALGLIAIVVVGQYFWVGGLATKQPTAQPQGYNEPGYSDDSETGYTGPVSKGPGLISAMCQDGELVVWNIGTIPLTDVEPGGDHEIMDSGSLTKATGSDACAGNELPISNSCVYAKDVTGSGTLYGPSIGAATYNC